MSTLKSTLMLFGCLLVCLDPASAYSQAVCRTTKQADAKYVGLCIERNDTVMELSLTAPLANEATLWRGAAKGDGIISTVAVDQAGVFRYGRFWAEVKGVKVGTNTFEFSFHSDSTITPTEDDLRILQRVRSHFEDAANWNHAPDPDIAATVKAFLTDPKLSRGGYCPAPTQRTLFCAMYEASIAQTGEFWFGRPAVNALRAAVVGDSGNRLRHPLMQFNGAPETKLTDVQRVLDIAIAYIKERQMCGVQYWVWGYTPSKHCRD